MATQAPRGLREVMRDEMVMRPRITAALREGPKTIPEIEKDLANFEVIAFEFAKAADDRFAKYLEEENSSGKKLNS